MSTFLKLVNKINRRVNEVELNSSNFGSARGFYATAKDAINDSIFRINQHQFQWPFNHSTVSQTLTVNTARYPFPSDAKYLDFDSFRLVRDQTLGVDTTHLVKKDYEEYLKRGIDSEYNIEDNSAPEMVTQSQGREFVLYPSPDKAYRVDYEYWRVPTELVLYSDEPSIPDQFDHVIVNGAMEYVYDFRGDTETSLKFARKFEDQTNEMRTIYTNRQDALKDTRVLTHYSRPSGYGRI